MGNPRERMDELIEKFEKAFRESWGKDTYYPPLQNEWTSENPALGQCAATALAVKFIFGGKIISCAHAHHYWNRLDNGREIDFTKSQFLKETRICEDCEANIEYMLKSSAAKAANTEARYEILFNRVMDFIMRE